MLIFIKDTAIRIIRSRQFYELHKSALPLATGFIGTVGVFLIQLPMPALLGPMLVNGFLCLNGLKMNISRLFFPPIFITIGIYIGSKMGPDTFDKIITWLPSIIFLLVCMVLATAAAAYYLQRYAKFDKLTAVYSSLPGAFASIIAQTSHLNIDHKKIIMAQSIRVFLVVGLLPLLLVLYINEPLYSGAVSDAVATNNSWLSWVFCIVLIICLSGVLVNFKIPSPYLLGGIIGSGFFFATGQLSCPLPNIPLIIALYLLGSIIGTRFSGCRWGELAKLGLHSLAVSFIIILCAAVGAMITSLIMNINVLSLLLAYGPGGINEISIIAYTFDITPTLVVFLHFIRILVITFTLPFIPRILGVPNPVNLNAELLNKINLAVKQNNDPVDASQINIADANAEVNSQQFSDTDIYSQEESIRERQPLDENSQHHLKPNLTETAISNSDKNIPTVHPAKIPVAKAVIKKYPNEDNN